MGGHVQGSGKEPDEKWYFKVWNTPSNPFGDKAFIYIFDLYTYLRGLTNLIKFCCK